MAVKRQKSVNAKTFEAYLGSIEAAEVRIRFLEGENNRLNSENSRLQDEIAQVKGAASLLAIQLEQHEVRLR